MSELPPVPLTLEGSWVLHQLFRFRRPDWQALPAGEQAELTAELTDLLTSWESALAPASASVPERPAQSALFAPLGHKGDLLFLHFRPTVDELGQAELQLASTGLAKYLEPTSSYVSVVELGLYESSTKAYEQLQGEGLAEHSPEWTAALAEITDRQSRAMASRLYPSIPEGRYLCFYPMDRRRGEQANWYTQSMAERRRMMHEHGLIGRRYADQVRQIISGSIGFDDWEWGVDLFADDPLVFKKLIYEMRFDEVSAVYALFGAFVLATRLPAAGLPAWLKGPQNS